MTIATIVIVLALICFLLDAFGVSFGRVTLTPLGLALFMVSILIGGAALH